MMISLVDFFLMDENTTGSLIKDINERKQFAKNSL